MSDQNAIHVLLVDDEKDFLAGTARALERRGFTVTAVENAAGALAAMKEKPIQVAVLDVRLPDADGHELFLELRKHYPEVQGIILTGNRNESQSFSLSHKGLFEYLDKPCDLELLARTIFDAYRQGQGEEEAESPAAAGTREPVRVLLIDDEEDFLKSMGRLLKRRGMIVYLAASGEEGLRLLDREEVEVAVIDLKMPGLSGMEVLQEIKRKKPGVEAIILTGHATVASGVEGMKQGAADYLFKPQDPDALVHAIEYAASKRFQKVAKKRKWWPWG